MPWFQKVLTQAMWPVTYSHWLVIVYPFEWVVTMFRSWMIGLDGLLLAQESGSLGVIISYPMSNINRTWNVLSWNVQGLNGSRN
jgi:hypothetical protein